MIVHEGDGFLAQHKILGSKHIYRYRNKLEFAFADHQWLTYEQMKAGVPFTPGLGFHIPNCFDKVLQIDECHLMDEYNNAIRDGIYAKAQELGLTFYNERTHEGELRNLILRSNHMGELMLVVVFGAFDGGIFGSKIGKIQCG